MVLFETNLLCNIIDIFETAMENQFDLWDMRKYDESPDYACNLRVFDPDNIK